VLNGIDIFNPQHNTFRERLLNIISQYDDNTASMLQTYRSSSFDQRHNVLLVAHSQGNLFGNKINELLTTKEKERFRMVSVATPADNVAGDFTLSALYTTLAGDIVIAAIPGSFAGNASGFGHTFVESYLFGSAGAASKIDADIRSAAEALDALSCKSYLYFRWISYLCPNGNDHPTGQELIVDIMGSFPDGSVNREEHVVSDTRIKAPKDENGNCLISGWDYRTATPNYDKGGCMAYTFDDTSGNYHTIDYIANHVYENAASCTKYMMDPSVADTLKAMQH
jgi:hypothetical protein